MNAPQVAAPTGASALAALEAMSDAGRAAQMAVHHKAPRVYLGVPAPQIETLVAGWRGHLDVAMRVQLAGALWDSDVHEARVAAAKLLTQARIPADEPLVWAEVARWVPMFDAWAVADQACKACERRLVADPARLDIVERWVDSPSMWVRRAALVATLPWSKSNHPTLAETAARARILGWAERLVADKNWFIQKAVAWWLRSLSIHDPARARAFLDGPGVRLKAFAREDAARRLP